MRIIQRGINLKFSRPKPLICPKCGCVFEVQQPNDVNWTQLSLNANIYGPYDQMFVTCPNSSCRFDKRLSSEEMGLIKNRFPNGPWNNPKKDTLNC